MELRPYQREAVDAIYSYFSANDGNPLIVLPTGCGKSIVLATFLREAVEGWADTRVLVLTHIRELIQQDYAALIRLWPTAPAGIYSAGLNKRDIDAQILFAGIQSIYKRAYGVQRCDLVLIDEAHLLGESESGMYRQFLRELRQINPMLKVIGLTATPYRMKTGLLHEGEGRLFTDVAYEVPILQMIEQGYLAPVVPKKTDTQLDVSGVGTRGGEFIASELERAVDLDPINQSAVAEIVRHGADRGSWLIFCAGVQHATHIRDAIRSHGISCETVTGDTPTPERDRILAAFKSGKLRAVTNMGVLTTGFDAPGIDLIAMLRPTKSVGLYCQMLGRGTRLANGKENCLILDCAGNTLRHGPLDRVDGKVKRKGDGGGDAPVKTCPDCQTICHASVRQCSECGHEFPAPQPELSAFASTAAILSTQLRPEWLEVTRVGYKLHQKPDKPPTMRVDYLCGLVTHSEWVCFQHTGYPREKAIQWWRKRSPSPVPTSIMEAVTASPSLQTPTHIQVRPAGKYTEIVGVRFES